MDALEAFSKIAGLWPKSFQPREEWRPLVIGELETWTAQERADALNDLMGRAKTVDLKTLKAAKVRAGKAGKQNTSANTEDIFLTSLGLGEAYKSQSAGDRVMISRLIRSLMVNPGWEAQLEAQAGDPKLFKPWERIENLLRCADKAMIVTGEGVGRKVCYPADHHGWEAPKAGPVSIYLPRPRHRADVEADRAGLRRISEIAGRFGGFITGQTGNVGAIYASAEYQQYLQDYTQRTGLKPA